MHYSRWLSFIVLLRNSKVDRGIKIQDLIESKVGLLKQKALSKKEHPELDALFTL